MWCLHFTAKTRTSVLLTCYRCALVTSSSSVCISWKFSFDPRHGYDVGRGNCSQNPDRASESKLPQPVRAGEFRQPRESVFSKKAGEWRQCWVVLKFSELRQETQNLLLRSPVHLREHFTIWNTRCLWLLSVFERVRTNPSMKDGDKLPPYNDSAPKDVFLERFDRISTTGRFVQQRARRKDYPCKNVHV